MSDVASLLSKPEFPLSRRYSVEWMLDNQMGPSAVWLTEWLCQTMPLVREMRVLDLGCGRALSSVFLARELGARVWAADLWMSPDHNWSRIQAAGLEDQICPLRVEAHALPFSQGFFDAVISIDAYQYFGTDELYLGYLSSFVRPGGVIGIVVPGLTQELGDGVPEHLRRPQANGKVFWEDECHSFRTAAWWQALWGRCGRVAEITAATLPDGWRHWRDFEEALELAGKSVFPSDAEALDRDQGRYLGFVKLQAQRTAAPSLNLYDPALGVAVGVDGPPTAATPDGPCRPANIVSPAKVVQPFVAGEPLEEPVSSPATLAEGASATTTDPRNLEGGDIRLAPTAPGMPAVRLSSTPAPETSTAADREPSSSTPAAGAKPRKPAKRRQARQPRRPAKRRQATPPAPGRDPEEGP